jgi:hypothetical protein
MTLLQSPPCHTTNYYTVTLHLQKRLEICDQTQALDMQRCYTVPIELHYSELTIIETIHLAASSTLNETLIDCEVFWPIGKLKLRTNRVNIYGVKLNSHESVKLLPQNKLNMCCNKTIKFHVKNESKSYLRNVRFPVNVSNIMRSQTTKQTDDVLHVQKKT